MKQYEVIMEATVCVIVDADDEDDAIEQARTAFSWTDVQIEGVISVDRTDV